MLGRRSSGLPRRGRESPALAMKTMSGKGHRFAGSLATIPGVIKAETAR